MYRRWALQARHLSSASYTQTKTQTQRCTNTHTHMLCVFVCVCVCVCVFVCRPAAAGGVSVVRQEAETSSESSEEAKTSAVAFVCPDAECTHVSLCPNASLYYIYRSLYHVYTSLYYIYRSLYYIYTYMFCTHNIMLTLPLLTPSFDQRKKRPNSPIWRYKETY